MRFHCDNSRPKSVNNPKSREINQKIARNYLMHPKWYDEPQQEE